MWGPRGRNARVFLVGLFYPRQGTNFFRVYLGCGGVGALTIKGLCVCVLNNIDIIRVYLGEGDALSHRDTMEKGSARLCSHRILYKKSRPFTWWDKKMQKYAQELNRSLFLGANFKEQAKLVISGQVKAWSRQKFGKVQNSPGNVQRLTHLARGWAGSIFLGCVMGSVRVCSRRAGLPRTESLLGLFKMMQAKSAE